MLANCQNNLSPKDQAHTQKCLKVNRVHYSGYQFDHVLCRILRHEHSSHPPQGVMYKTPRSCTGNTINYCTRSATPVSRMHIEQVMSCSNVLSMQDSNIGLRLLLQNIICSQVTPCCALLAAGSTGSRRLKHDLCAVRPH